MSEALPSVINSNLTSSTITSAVLSTGTVTQPVLSFSNSSTTGIYSKSTGHVTMTSAGNEVCSFNNTIASLKKPLQFSADTSATGDNDNINVYKTGENLYWNMGSAIPLTNQDRCFKLACRVVTTTNITLSSTPDTVDSVALNINDRILVTGQNNTDSNGIYRVVTVGTGSDGTWSRVVDLSTNKMLEVNTLIAVIQGNNYGGTLWRVTAVPSIFNTDPLTFERYYINNSQYYSYNTEISGAITSLPSVITVIKNSNTVTLTLPTFTGTSTTSDTIATTVAMNSVIRPSENIQFAVLGVDNGTAKVCSLKIGSNGIITISNGPADGTSFTGSGITGVYRTSVSWIV